MRFSDVELKQAHALRIKGKLDTLRYVNINERINFIIIVLKFLNTTKLLYNLLQCKWLTGFRTHDLQIDRWRLDLVNVKNRGEGGGG